MADRRTLHKTKLGDFKTFLNSEGIAYRDGKGTYQALQVLTKNDGWQCIHIKNEMPEHFSVQDKLMPLVKKFLNSNTEEKEQRISVPLKPFKELLTALVSESCFIRELQATMSLSEHFENHKPNCIQIMINEYNDFVDRDKHQKETKCSKPTLNLNIPKS